MACEREKGRGRKHSFVRTTKFRTNQSRGVLKMARYTNLRPGKKVKEQEKTELGAWIFGHVLYSFKG